MKYIIFILVISIILEIYIVCMSFCCNKFNTYFRIFNILVFILLFVLCFYGIGMFYDNIFSIYYILVSLFCILYTILAFVYFFVNRNRYISLFSVKEALDKSYNGIMFFDKKGSLFLINSTMKGLLKSLRIYNNYLEQLISKNFKKIKDGYLIKNNNDIWLIKIISSYEIHAIKVTDVYKLNEKYELQNKALEEYNKKLFEALDNTNETRKEKNLIKLKNEFHDLLGHRLSLFKGYLDSDSVSVSNIKYMISNLFCDDTKEKSVNKLIKLIDIYKVLGIKINLKGNLPRDERGDIFFEIIREGITNAILHGGSKNIDVNICENSMMISNDGLIPTGKIVYGEGIKGMKRKLASIGGYLNIEYREKFIIRVEIK